MEGDCSHHPCNGVSSDQLHSTTPTTFLQAAYGGQCLSNNLKVLYFNSRSILPKIGELCLLARMYDPECTCIVDSSLSPNIDSTEIAVEHCSCRPWRREERIQWRLMNCSREVAMATGSVQLPLTTLRKPADAAQAKECVSTMWKRPTSLNGDATCHCCAKHRCFNS